MTNKKDTIKGDIKYNVEANLITMIVNDKARTYSSQKVFYFEIFDKILNNYRQFYSIQFQVNYNYKIPIFFEVVYEDRVSLLRRERIITRSANTTSAYWGEGNFLRPFLEYSYYFLDDKGKISFFSGRKKDLLVYMSDKQSSVKKFIKDNKLNTERATDLVKITAFYNSK